MFNYKKATSILLASAVLGMTPSLFADDHTGEEPAPPVFGIEGFNVETEVYKPQGGDADTQSYAGMTLRITEKLKTNIGVRLEEGVDMLEDGDINSDSIGAFLAQMEGVLEFDAHGKPVLFVWGKLKESDFRQDMKKVALSSNFEVASTELEEVFGFYVEVTETVFDSIKVAVTETEGGDFDLGKEIRVTVNAHHKLNEMVDLYGGLAYEFADSGDDADQDAGAANIGANINLDGIWEGLSTNMDLTISEDGFNGARGTQTTFGLALEKDNLIVDGLTGALGYQGTRDNYVERDMIYVGAEKRVGKKGNGTLYGQVGYQKSKVGGVESEGPAAAAGIKIAIPKK